MKKLTLSLLLMALPLAIFAEKKVIVRTGTTITLVPEQTIRASKVKVGEKVYFRVQKDIIAEGLCAIPEGTIVEGRVTKARKSSIFGTKGKLGIEIQPIIMKNGETLYLDDTDVEVSGKNRTPLSLGLMVFYGVSLFIPGSRAEMSEDYEVFVRVVANTPITAKE